MKPLSWYLALPTGSLGDYRRRVNSSCDKVDECWIILSPCHDQNSEYLGKSFDSVISLDHVVNFSLLCDYFLSDASSPAYEVLVLACRAILSLDILPPDAFAATRSLSTTMRLKCCRGLKCGICRSSELSSTVVRSLIIAAIQSRALLASRVTVPP